MLPRSAKIGAKPSEIRRLIALDFICAEITRFVYTRMHRLEARFQAVFFLCLENAKIDSRAEMMV
jgi:hypothetical protein